MNKKILNILVITILISQNLFLSLNTPAGASIFNNKKEISEDTNSRLKELSEISKLNHPIFGKVVEPLKGGVAIYRYVPEKIYIKKLEEEPQIEDSIALLPSKKVNKISDLEKKREEIQKAEVEGLNFIQPSLNLTEKEQQAIDEFFTRNEQEQLLTLWSSTIERNKTIQYIVQRLSPEEDTQQAKSFLSKTVGAAIFLPFYAIQAFTNNSGAYYGSQLGSRVLGSVVQGKMQKNKDKLQLTQTEAIVLFMMIDEVAERLRQRYHNYKRLLVEKSLATNELKAAKNDNLAAHEQNAPAAQILADIQRRAVEREIRRLDTETRYFKNSLIELAGLEAVTALDDQLKLELTATNNIPLDFKGTN